MTSSSKRKHFFCMSEVINASNQPKCNIIKPEIHKFCTCQICIGSCPWECACVTKIAFPSSWPELLYLSSFVISTLTLMKVVGIKCAVEKYTLLSLLCINGLTPHIVAEFWTSYCHCLSNSPHFLQSSHFKVNKTGTTYNNFYPKNITTAKKKPNFSTNILQFVRVLKWWGCLSTYIYTVVLDLNN